MQYPDFLTSVVSSNLNKTNFNKLEDLTSWVVKHNHGPIESLFNTLKILIIMSFLVLSYRTKKHSEISASLFGKTYFLMPMVRCRVI